MTEARRERIAVQTTVVVTAFNYAGMAISLITVPLYLRWLGSESYGRMLTVLAFMGYLEFSSGGLNWGSMVLLSKAHGTGDRQAFVSVFRHSLLLVTAAAGLALFTSSVVWIAAQQGWRLPMFDSSHADSLLLLVGAQCAANVLCNSIYSVFFGLQQGYWAGLYQGMARILSGVAGAFAACLYRTPASALCAQTAAILVCGVVGALQLLSCNRWLLTSSAELNGQQFRALFSTARNSFTLKVARTVHGTAPVMVLSSIAGSAVVPTYTVAATLLNAVFGVLLSWSASLQPAYGSAWASGDRTWVVSTFIRSLRWAILVAAVTVAGYVVGAPDVIGVWTGGKLQPDRIMCLSVAAVLTIQVVSSTVQFCLSGIDRHRRIAKLELVHASTAFVLALAFVDRFGPAGVGLGMVAAYMFTSAPFGIRELALRLEDATVVPRSRWFFGVAAAATAGACIGLAVRGWLSEYVPTLASALLAASISGLCTVFALAVLGVQRLNAWPHLLRRRLPASS